MLPTYRVLSTEQPELASYITDLLESTARYFLFFTAMVFIIWFMLTIDRWTEIGLGFIAMMCWFIFIWGFTWWLLSRSMLIAQLTWHGGALLLITLFIWVYQEPRIAFLAALLPLTATVTLNWKWGLALEGLIFAWLLKLGDVPGLMPVPVIDQWNIIVGGGITGMLGWLTTRAFLTTTQWAVQGFEQARQSRDEARLHRGQLAVAYKNMDLAYYRLERSNTSLVVARHAAEEAERFKSEFVTNVSHELRTPLNLIIGFSEIMLVAPESYGGVPLPPAYRGDLNAICHNAQHLLALVDDVLDMARIEVGKISLTRSEVDFNALIMDAVGMLSEYIHAKGLEIRLNLATDLPLLWIDPLRIRQVLLNLLVNAARFTERGWVQVESRREGEKILVRISDTGRGILPQDLPKVFEEFRSTEQPVSTWHSGTGLGLPICKRFVELHHGHIGVESEPQHGTTFWFTLPAAAEIASKDGAAAGQERFQSVEPLSFPECILIIVHDDPNVAHLLQRYLEGVRVIGVTNIQEGYRLAQEIKAVAILTDLPLVTPPPLGTYIVQCPLPSRRQAAAALGADDLLIKPVSQADLVAAIDRLNISPRRVLIADDNLEVIRLFRRMLSTHPAVEECIEAHNGEETLELMLTTKPDLVLLDLVMPKVDGQIVLERIETNPELEKIPVILITAKSQDYMIMPMSGTIQIKRPDGYKFGDVVSVLDAILKVLAPGWRHLEANGKVHSAAPTETPVSPGNPPPQAILPGGLL